MQFNFNHQLSNFSKQHPYSWRGAGLVAFVFAAMLSLSTNVFAVCTIPQFGNPTTLTVNNPAAAAIGDFNRDGREDLAVLSSADGAVEVLLGNGTTLASTSIRYAAIQSTVGDLATGDFNNDGILDLVATGGPSTQRVAAILIGNGSGGFGSPANFSVGTFPNSVKVADFNNDGRLDIITTNNVGSTVSILPGQDNGTFAAALSISVSGQQESIAVSDFNNDGNADFITLNNTSNTATIKLGGGNFSFTNPTPATVSLPDPNEIIINDFNRDGRQDFATTNIAGDGIGVRLGAGAGVFNSPSGDPFVVGPDPISIASADLNNDGFPDIATGNNGTGGSNNVSILLNNGSGGFGSAFNYTIENGRSDRIYTMDFSQNGVSDLVILKDDLTDRIVLLPNTCPPPSRFDFDGDGKADVSVFRPTGGTWYLQQSTSGFSGVAFGLSSDKIVPADYDGDGKTDVAVYRDGTWYLQRSQLGFTGIAFGTAEDIPIPADFDGDFKADLAVFRPSSGTWYVQQSINGYTGIQFGQIGDRPVPADYDGDGRADVTVYRGGTWYVNRSSLGLIGFQFGDSNDKAVPADYDGDGKTDVAVFRPSNGTWYLQRSALGLLGIQFGQTGDLPVPSDYDGDHKADLAVYRAGTWYLNRSTNGFAALLFGNVSDLPIPNAFIR